MSFSTRGGACGVFIEQTQLKPRHKSITAHSRLPRISTAPLKAKSHEKFPSRHKWAVQGAQGAFIILLAHPNYNVSNPCPENISYYTTQPSIGPRFAHRTTQTIKALCQLALLYAHSSTSCLTLPHPPLTREQHVTAISASCGNLFVNCVQEFAHLLRRQKGKLVAPVAAEQH